MGYILVFTFLSLFESGIGMFQVSAYFYGWGLAMVGLLLQLTNRYAKFGPELDEPTRQGSQVFLPVALLVSLFAVPTIGYSQLGVSLLLAAMFYGLEALRTNESVRETNAFVSHATFNAAGWALAYGLSDNWRVGILAMLVLTGLELIVLLLQKWTLSKLWQNYASAVLVTALATVLLSVQDARLAMCALGLVVITGAVMWLKQRRAEGYAFGGLALMALPFVFGQAVLVDFPPVKQALLALMTLLVLLEAYLEGRHHSNDIANWDNVASLTYGLGVAAVVITSLFASAGACLLVVLGVVVTLIVLAETDKRAEWAEAAAIVIAVPAMRSLGDARPFLIAVAVALAVMVALAVRYRRELLRWSVSLTCLVLAYAMASGGFGREWSAAGYAWIYVVAMVGLIVSRAIARGVILFSGRVTISSLTRQASMSYVVGYSLAASIAVACSLASPDSRLHTTLILALTTGTTWLLSRYVEKRADILAFVPVFLQAVLVSGMRPLATGDTLVFTLLASSILALMCYAETWHRVSSKPELLPVVQTSVLMAFVSPLAIIFVPASWTMMVGLLLAGSLLLHLNWRSTQANREWSATVMVVAVMWFLYWAGVREAQAYVHVIVAMLAGYAYWRFRRGEREQSDQYIWGALMTATLPLALQALGGESGGLYGWWLLLEQVVIMLVGMSIKRRFVTMWGLYVAVGAVLYQLRSLGYAALAVLAIFLIGLAVYKLSKSDKPA
jgi:hypothetical protein